jgi:hypothetical protein
MQSMLKSFRALAQRIRFCDRTLAKRLNYARTAVAESSKADENAIGVAVIHTAYHARTTALWVAIKDLEVLHRAVDELPVNVDAESEASA